MQDYHEWRTGRHAVFELYIHLVFTTKYRRKVFTDPMLKRLEIIMREKCTEMEAELIEFNGETEHVHLLVNFPAKISISELVRLLKGVSSRLIRQEFWDQVKDKLWGDHFWSPSYCAVTAGGAPLEIIKKYIEDQNRPSSENQKKMSAVANKRWEKK
jgi:putative transposase